MVAAPALPVEERMLSAYPTVALETVRRLTLATVSSGATLPQRARGVLNTAYRQDFSALFAPLLSVPAAIRAEEIPARTRVIAMDADIAAQRVALAQARQELRQLGCPAEYLTVIEVRANSTSPQHRVSAACATTLMAAVLSLEAGQYTTNPTPTIVAVPAPVPPVTTPPPLDQSLGTAFSLSAPLTDAEQRLRLPFETPGLETLRRGVLQLVTGATALDQRIRSALLLAYQNDFAAIFADILPVPQDVLGEVIPKRRKLFTMLSDLRALDRAAADARLELAQIGLNREYVELLTVRYQGASPQHRISAACAHLFFGAAVLLEAPRYASAPTRTITPAPAVEPPVVVPPVPDQSLGTELSRTAPLTTVEQRLRVPFETPGLETLRRGVLQLVTGASILDQRIRSALLLAHQNDFVPIFADIMPVPAEILLEVIPKRRKLFTMMADLRAWDVAAASARLELARGGLPREYVELLTVRYLSASPQHKVTAACAHLFFGALLFPAVPETASNAGRYLATEANDPLLTEANAFMET